MAACRVLGDSGRCWAVDVYIFAVDILSISIEGGAVLASCVSLFEAIKLELWEQQFST